MYISARNVIACLLLAPIAIHARINPSQEQRRMLTTICSYQGPRTFLLSFPQSGNTWLRYCLEFLTQRPTLHRNRTQPRWHDFHYAHPLAWKAGFDIDEHKPLIEKIHQDQESLLMHNQQKISLNHDADTLIFILRNPKESIARSEYSSWESLLESAWGSSYPHRIYFENLALFDNWPADRRYLIYYEDLINAPRETLTALLEFLHESTTRLDQFMDEYADHKARCLALYPNPTSRGSDPLFHSKKLSPAFRKQVDAWIADAYPEFSRTYLQRYIE
jgi:hypothetical protein